MFLIANGDPPKLAEQAKWSANLHDLLSKILVKEETERPTAGDLLMVLLN